LVYYLAIPAMIFHAISKASLSTQFDVKLQDYLPGLILLASPTATLTYVMAKEMSGDTDFAVAALSSCTILSAATFSIWLHIAAG
jgi:predicted permease